MYLSYINTRRFVPLEKKSERNPDSCYNSVAGFFFVCGETP